MVLKFGQFYYSYIIQKRKKMKRILITGAAGFIGFHTALALHKEHFIIGLDNFTPYYDVELKKARARILQKNGIETIDASILETDLIEQLIDKEKITHVIHLAAQPGVRYSLEHPQKYIEANLAGFVSILEACRIKKNISVVYASSSSIYGTNTKIPFSENDQTDSPSSLYGATKKADELIAHSYHHLYGLNLVGLRFFTVYGPWGRPDMAYFSFTKNILEGKEIPVFNHGKMQRDFTYIDDIIQGITASLDIKGLEIFNLGNNNPVYLLDFIQEIEKAVGKKAIKKMMPMQLGDVEKTYADIEKSKAQLGFNPKTDISKGIPLFVKWYLDYYSA